MSVLRCKANQRYQLAYVVQPAPFLVLLTRNDKHESALYFKCATYKIMAKISVIEVHQDYCSSRLVHRNIQIVPHHIKGTWLH